MDQIECLVIGAGVVGLAIARALALAGREVVIVEENARIGEESSSRNNEVIHAGCLYPAGSLKERLCLAGRERLYAYCRERGIGHARIGKLLPATSDDEVRLLVAYRDRAAMLGVNGVELLDGSAMRALEPELVCLAALHSRLSGIVDSHALMVSLLGDAEAGGAALAVNSRVTQAAQRDGGGFTVDIASTGAGNYQLGCDMLINAAGLGALPLAQTVGGYPAGLLPRIFFARGSFFSYQGRAPFHHLVMPVGATLAGGAAFTLDLAGQGRFGPDLQWIDQRDYGVDASAAPRFADSVRRYWPGIDADRLAPAYAGIRPRTTGPGEPPGDWVVHGPRDHGIDGLVNLFAIDTPGLTACLAIADHVLRLLVRSPDRECA